MTGVQLKSWCGGGAKPLIPDISNLLLIAKNGFPKMTSYPGIPDTGFLSAEASVICDLVVFIIRNYISGGSTERCCPQQVPILSFLHMFPLKSDRI